MADRLLGRLKRVSRSSLFVGAICVLLFVQALYVYSVCNSRVFLLVCCLAVAGVAALHVLQCYLAKKRINTTEKSFYLCFSLVLLACGLAYMIVFPPGTVPDEQYHFEASYKLANHLMFTTSSSDEIILMRDADSAFMGDSSLFSTNVDQGTYRSLASSFSFFSDGNGMVEVTAVPTDMSIGQNPPQLKLPSALGIVGARLLGLGPIPLFYLGRLFNFLYYGCLVLLALKYMPFGKKAMAAVALLPMTLHISSSYSYDAGIIGLGFLLSALMFDAIYGKGALTVRRCIGLLVVSVLLAPCKVVYSVIIFLVLLIPQNRFPDRKKSVCFKMATLVLSIASLLVLRLGSISDLAGGNDAGTVDMRGTESGVMYDLSYILSNPIDIIIMFVRTFVVRGDSYLSSVVGGNLGWFQPDLAMPQYIVFGLWIILIVAVQRTSDDSMRLPSSHRIIFFVLGLLCVLGCMLSMLLGWTFTNETVIQGVQGRYFIPVIPLMLLALRFSRVFMQGEFSYWIVFGMAVANVFYLMLLFSRILV